MGLLAALPYLGNAIIVQFGGHLADHLRTRFKISTTIVMIDITLFKQHVLLYFSFAGKVRKVFTSGSYLIQMSFLLVTAQMTHSPALALTCLVIAVSSGGFAAYGLLTIIYF